MLKIQKMFITWKDNLNNFDFEDLDIKCYIHALGVVLEVE